MIRTAVCCIVRSNAVHTAWFKMALDVYRNVNVEVTAFLFSFTDIFPVRYVQSYLTPED
jgi:hypothetical protein